LTTLREAREYDRPPVYGRVTSPEAVETFMESARVNPTQSLKDYITAKVREDLSNG
jgi:hypothetical protein